ncbi:MAG TPA: SAM-dependent methyltransferase [Thermoanaerobaculia bacterium]|nr:SAM-dependent methyltransferase [Thermoanaerobaculia bacterium]
MTDQSPTMRVLRNLLQYGDLSFRDFVEIALYHPEAGYYMRPLSPVGKEGDYVTSPALSPVFSYAIGRLIDEFVARADGALCTFVDIGCGEGTVLKDAARRIRAIGIDRRLGNSLLDVPREGLHLFFSNELFDALPFARLVKRRDELHELWVDANLDWTEHEAPAVYGDYFASHGIELEDGQFADVSLDWANLYREIVSYSEQALIVTFDYGYRARQLFHPRIRRFGTAASYAKQRVTRDLLANPGEQDLTAHINFDDLIRAGEELGTKTLFFDRQVKFLLALGITEHPLFAPLEDEKLESVEAALALREAREEARRLVLPDGIGEEIRVLVQARGVPLEGWSFQRNITP